MVLVADVQYIGGIFPVYYNDTLYSFVVNFDNFCKNTHLRFAERHKAKVTGVCRGCCSSFQSLRASNSSSLQHCSSPLRQETHQEMR